jgi:hypothetical protein
MKVIVISVIGFVLGSFIGCYFIEPTYLNEIGRKYASCEIPDDVPKEYVWGPSVRWDCTLHGAYVNGDLQIIYPKNGDSTKCESIRYEGSDGEMYLCDFEKITAH